MTRARLARGACMHHARAARDALKVELRQGYGLKDSRRMIKLLRFGAHMHSLGARMKSLGGA